MLAYRNMIRHELDTELISEIRNAANTGLVLGAERFKTEIEQLTGQRQHQLKRGPKSKAKPHPNEEFLL